jgi:hypothetical protein
MFKIHLLYTVVVILSPVFDSVVYPILYLLVIDIDLNDWLA